jgi:hypothetical protein
MTTQKRMIQLLVVAAAALAVGCSSATPTDTPGVDRLGEYIVRQTGPEVDTILGYRFAASSVGNEWLILEVAVTSPNGQSADIKRDDVFVLTPSGQRIPLATQREFGEAYGGLRSTLQKASITRDPMGYFKPSREACDLGFFTDPGGKVVFDELSLNDRRGCQGQLFFRVPGGIQHGKWTLGIDLEESDVRIPFKL